MSGYSREIEMVMMSGEILKGSPGKTRHADRVKWKSELEPTLTAMTMVFSFVL